MMVRLYYLIWTLDVYLNTHSYSPPLIRCSFTILPWVSSLCVAVHNLGLAQKDQSLNSDQRKHKIKYVLFPICIPLSWVHPCSVTSSICMMMRLLIWSAQVDTYDPFTAIHLQKIANRCIYTIIPWVQLRQFHIVRSLKDQAIAGGEELNASGCHKLGFVYICICTLVNYISMCYCKIYSKGIYTQYCITLLPLGHYLQVVTAGLLSPPCITSNQASEVKKLP